MPYYSFDVQAHYHTDPIYAETEAEARKIAFDELQYCGEEQGTEFRLIGVEYDDDEAEEGGTE